MKLNKLALRNFKGLANFRLDTDGKNVSVFGENATGKTTLYDAFLWLLFGKNSDGLSDFTVEPLDASGSRIPDLETSVYAEIDTVGGLYRLERRRSENWVKERGSSTTTFKGFNTTYYADGLPMKEAAWKELIGSFCKENLFKLLTNPRAFPAMPWKDQRSTLFAVCGDICDQDIVDAHPSLVTLNERGRHLVDQWKQIQQARRKELAEQLNKLPDRMDEARRAIHDDADIPTAQAEITRLTVQRAALEAQLKPADGAELTAKINALRMELNTLMGQNQAHRLEQGMAAQVNRQELTNCLSSNKSRILNEQQDANAAHFRTKTEWELADKTTDGMRAEWLTLFEKTWSGAETCYACKRQLPSDEIAQAKSAFNLDKSTRLEGIERLGRESKSKAAELAVILEKLAITIAELTEQKADIIRQIDGLPELLPAEDMPDYITHRTVITAELAILEGSDHERQAAALEASAQTRQQIAALRDEITRLDMAIITTHNNDTQRKRVEELKGQQKTVAAELEQVDKRIELCEEFTRAKVGAVEGRINSKFNMPGLAFKLFETQINGGIADCCTLTYQGVDYKDLNNAAQINTGLAIIDTLAQHHGIEPIIFVDNAEAVTRLLPIKAQIIRLVVSDKHQKLTVEEENNG